MLFVVRCRKLGLRLYGVVRRVSKVVLRRGRFVASVPDRRRFHRYPAVTYRRWLVVRTFLTTRAFFSAPASDSVTAVNLSGVELPFSCGFC